MANGLIIAAPRTGSGKTLLTLGLARALSSSGLRVAPAKTGPDYIDGALLARAAIKAATSAAINLDPWAMAPQRLRALAAGRAATADLLLVEGVMGLFDGAADGHGSTGDLAAVLGLPVILVVDAERQGQSIAALVHGFASWRPEVRIAGLIVNRVSSPRHQSMLRAALAELPVPVLGMVPRRDGLRLPERHLGLVLPGEIGGFDAIVAEAAAVVRDHVDLALLLSLSEPLAGSGREMATGTLPPLGQHVAIARDAAFAFVYPHWLDDWRRAGAGLSFFSPLADEAPDPAADAVFLPGGYPELHAARLANAPRFLGGLRAAAARGALLYGECGGFMVLGTSLTDAAGATHKMAGLLPHHTRIDRPKRVLGYRRLTHASPLPFPAKLSGHEFHYSSAGSTHGASLFAATDALGEPLPPMGLVEGRIMGSYAHIIDVA